MAKELYLDDMQLQEFEATVLSITEDKFVVLDQTAFYPKSGGVDCDLGTISKDGKATKVLYVGKFKGQISHQVEEGSGLQEGDKIIGKIDWERRQAMVRYHTAAHCLSGAFYQFGDKLQVTGNDLTYNSGRMDFNMDEFDRELVANLVEKANAEIEKDHSVKTYYLSREEMEAQDDLMKLAMSLPKSLKTIRIVDIGFDRQPDGGCHVQSLKEIGKIKIEKLKSKGKNNRRLYYTLE